MKFFRPPFRSKQKVEELNRGHEIIKIADVDDRIICEVRKWPNERPLHFRRRAQATARALNEGAIHFDVERAGLEKQSQPT